jgi:hypothetical protein
MSLFLGNTCPKYAGLDGHDAGKLPLNNSTRLIIIPKITIIQEIKCSTCG